MSRTRQLGTSVGPRCKKASVVAKLSTCKPMLPIKSLSEERTDGSSSTTNTTPG
jgi:hypothetical protein